jgi:Sulfotransferase domain
VLVWLASYPRSGNSFFRTILRECFDLRTLSLYSASDDRVFSSPDVRRAIGHVSTDLAGRELIDFAHSASETMIIKTHEGPLTDDGAIHIVRNGQSALISYMHYIREVEGVDWPLEKIIRGEVFAGSWSDHYRMWAGRPNSMLLRFEDIVADPNATAEKVSEFLSLPIKRRYSTEFNELKKLHPAFFRSGNDAENVRELAAHKELKELFDSYHSEVMALSGY